MKKIITYLLLMNFLVLYTPRGIWHKCDDQKHKKETSKDFKIKTSEEDNFCLACDYDLSFSNQPSTFSFNFYSKHFETRNELLFNLHKGNSFANFLLRGPPVV